jgi:large subunit ribosomal protein L18
MKKNKLRFERRKERTRIKIRLTSDKPRLSVFRSNNHIEAQIIDDVAGVTLVAASSKQKEFSTFKSRSNKEVAKLVGSKLAKAATAKGLDKVVFDKGGYKYHGVVAALADAARSEGLNF